MGPAVAAASMVGIVLLAVVAKSVIHTTSGAETADRSARQLSGLESAATITDRDGRILAMSVPAYDLNLSPQAMWRSHTPGHMARVLLGTLEDIPAEDIPARQVSAFLERLLPLQSGSEEAQGASGGTWTVEAPRLLRFEVGQRDAVRHWIERGALPGEDDTDSLKGLRLVRLSGGNAWTLEWTPERLLSKGQRERHLWDGARARTWVDHLLDDLAVLVGEERLHLHLGARFASLSASQVRALTRDALWSELMPCQFRVARKDIDVPHAAELREVLTSEAVSSWQMKLDMRARRAYSLRPKDYQPAPCVELPGATLTDPMAVLGHWGRLDERAADAVVDHWLSERPEQFDWMTLGDPRALLREELVHQSRPMVGLELLVGESLAQIPWVELRPSQAEFVPRVLARDRRRELWPRGQRIPNELMGGSAASADLRVETTLDAQVQVFLHQELERTLLKHRAAMAMAIVIDPVRGDVLAVDAVHAYPVSGFAPLRHAFTPGSTLKAFIMAMALDQGVVTPEEEFRTFHAPGEDGLHLGSRHITEARGAPTDKWISASKALSRSVNAVMVQVGARVPAPVMRATLTGLGFGARPEVGLGPEAPGRIPPLDSKGTWSPQYTHASISFGHELTVTLWQLAGAMGALVRGGEHIPLHLVRAVEQGERIKHLPAPEGTRVLSSGACEQVRAMMARGAREGTGANVTRGHRQAFETLLGKTGTAQRVPTEGCLHDEQRAQAEAAAQGRSLTRAERKALRGSRNSGHKNCYTSSMCLVGQAQGADREWLVLVVVEEPRGSVHYGSGVAGPSAMRILRVAHGLSPELETLDASAKRGAGDVALDPTELHALSDQAWMEGGR